MRLAIKGEDFWMPATIENQSVLDKINSIPMVSTLGMEIDELTDEFCRVRVAHDRKYDGIFEKDGVL